MMKDYWQKGNMDKSLDSYLSDIECKCWTQDSPLLKIKKKKKGNHNTVLHGFLM